MGPWIPPSQAGDLAGTVKPVERQDQWFYGSLEADNVNGPVWHDGEGDTAVTVFGVVNDTPNSGSDTIALDRRSAYIPSLFQTLRYDPDGNLTAEDRWEFKWDAENRIREMETSQKAQNAGVPRERLVYRYDYQGRRTRKEFYLWDEVNSEWDLTKRTYFLWQGWLMAAERHEEGDGTFISERRYFWGPDLSGGVGGAGGIGGLLMIASQSGADPVEYWYPSYDGSGNLVALVDGDGDFQAQYEYGPFGEVLRASGPAAKLNPFRFSTKYTDDETGLVYYGYRYYSPELGRFISRDPIGEAGGINLYALAGNDPINFVDPYGLDGFSASAGGGKTLSRSEIDQINNTSSSGGGGTSVSYSSGGGGYSGGGGSGGSGSLPSPSGIFESIGELLSGLFGGGGGDDGGNDGPKTPGGTAPGMPSGEFFFNGAPTQRSSQGGLTNAWIEESQRLQRSDNIGDRFLSIPYGIGGAIAIIPSAFHEATQEANAGFHRAGQQINFRVETGDLDVGSGVLARTMISVAQFGQFHSNFVTDYVPSAQALGHGIVGLPEHAQEVFTEAHENPSFGTIYEASEFGLSMAAPFSISRIDGGPRGKIDYGSLDSLGRPTGVTAVITPDMIKTGSPALRSIKPPGFKGGAAGHARGHLLGSQLGGSGAEPRNLVTIQQNPANTPVMRGFETQIRNV
ncbi:MAG: RHS repeat-associated core domain-containing protein, partial [Cyanobacteria bacterium P01_F01_bin.153]